MTNGWTDERALRPLSAPVCPWADACCTGGARSCSVVAQAPGRVDCPLAAFLLRHVTHAYLWPAGILPPLRTCGVFGRHWAFWSLSLLLSMLGLAAQLGFAVLWGSGPGSSMSLLRASVLLRMLCFRSPAGTTNPVLFLHASTSTPRQSACSGAAHAGFAPGSRTWIFFFCRERL